jgi:hypothetical protein
VSGRVTDNVGQQAETQMKSDISLKFSVWLCPGVARDVTPASGSYAGRASGRLRLAAAGKWLRKGGDALARIKSARQEEQVSIIGNQNQTAACAMPDFCYTF